MPRPTGGVAASPLFQVHRDDTELVLLVNARNRALQAAQTACDSRVYFGGEQGGEEREGERNQPVHTNLPGTPVSENLPIANCNLLVCPPQVSHY